MGRDNLGCHIEAVYLRCSAATVGNLRMTKARVDGNGLGLSTVARSSNWTGPPTRFRYGGQPSPAFMSEGWWARVESNHRPLACEANALPLSHAPDQTISLTRPSLVNNRPTYS